MDTSLRSYEEDGTYEGETIFVDDVMYYDGTTPALSGDEMRRIKLTRELRFRRAIGAPGEYQEVSLRERMILCLPKEYHELSLRERRLLCMPY